MGKEGRGADAKKATIEIMIPIVWRRAGGLLWLDEMFGVVIATTTMVNSLGVMVSAIIIAYWGIRGFTHSIST